FELVQKLQSDQEHQLASMRRLEEVDLAKDAFISNVSHELRTPLTSIAGYLELITDGSFGRITEEVVEGLAVIRRNTERLRALVEDLLALSALDSRGFALNRFPLELAGVLQECEQSLEPTLRNRTLAVEMNVAPGVRVHADPTQIERIVLNLLSNAVKFTPDGGRVTLDAELQSDDVVITVSDTGIGIPEDEQGMVFDRFYRSSLATAEEVQGTGLGLALTKALVNQHAGTITISSIEGAGTTVVVTLPSGGPGA
ncbi:MAG: sensor histidine kinase, partial [Nocardioides sp.]